MAGYFINEKLDVIDLLNKDLTLILIEQKYAYTHQREMMWKCGIAVMFSHRKFPLVGSLCKTKITKVHTNVPRRMLCHTRPG